MMRKLLMIALLLVAGGIGWAGWSARPTTAQSTIPTLATVSRGSLQRVILASGAIEAARLVSIGAQVGGQIQSLPVTLGQVLAPGDLVAQIDPEDQQTSLARAESALAQVEAQILALRANIAEAESALDRKRQLTDKGLTSAQDLEVADAQLAVTRANLKSAEAQRAQAALTVQSARIALERTRITAPSPGTVVAVVLREGQTINANQSSPTVIKLADLTTMVVKAEISEADVIHVRPGQHAVFTLSGAPGLRFEAVLRAVEPAPSAIVTSDEIDTASAVYYNALLDVPNPDGLLRIGMSAEVTIELERADQALIVPLGAVRRDRSGGATAQVWDAASASSSPRAVTLGIADADSVVVLSGLAEGEQVVTSTTPVATGGPRRGPGPVSLF